MLQFNLRDRAITLMNSRLEQVKFWLRWVVVSTLSLGVSFAFLGWLDGLNYIPNSAYDFDSQYPTLLISLISGCFLGVMQWLLFKLYARQLLVQWVLGSMTGIVLMAVVSRIGFELYIWANFNKAPPGLDYLNFSVTNGAIAGELGGMVLGFIQGRTLRHKILWGLTNAIAWALSWGIGRAVRHIDEFRWYWTLNRFPLSIRLAIEMGVLGGIAGLISSVIAGVMMVQFLSRDRPSS